MSAGAEISYTVTFLEARARPERPRPALQMNARTALMRAETPPVHFFRYLYDTVGRDYEWRDMHAVSDADIAALVQHPDVALHVLYLTGWPAGFILLDNRPHDCSDIAYFGMTPEAMGRGLGDWLLGTGVWMAWDRGVGRLTVNTCSLDHPRALPLYQRWGFEPVRRETRTRVVTAPRG